MSKKAKKSGRRRSGNPKLQAQAAQHIEEHQEQVICATCKAPLSWYASVDSGTGESLGATSFQHARTYADRDADHEAKPYLGIPDPVNWVCDFCTTPGVAEVYVTRDVIVIELIDPTTGQKVQADGYNNIWAACARCGPLVGSRKLGELLDRVTNVIGLRNGFSAAEKKFYRGNYKILFEALYKAHVSGPFPLDLE